MTDPIKAYGWTAQVRDPALFLQGKNVKKPVPQTVESTKLPDTPLAKAIIEYAKRELPVQTFNHSMRVFYYGEKHDN
jgi:cyanamide hydratase